MWSHRVTSLILSGSLAFPYAAHADPGAFGAQVQAFQTRSALLSGGNNCDGNFCVFVFAQAYDEFFTGVGLGDVALNTSSLNIFCTGPQYANVLDVNKSSGAATLSVILDPFSTSCRGNYFGPPITINLTAQATGATSESSTGINTSFYGGVRTTNNFQTSLWGVVMNGTVGDYARPLTGVTQATRLSFRQQVK